jgi:hypothetical protein
MTLPAGCQDIAVPYRIGVSWWLFLVPPFFSIDFFNSALSFFVVDRYRYSFGCILMLYFSFS